MSRGTFGTTPELLGFTSKGTPLYPISGADDDAADGDGKDDGGDTGAPADDTKPPASDGLGDAGKRALDAERTARRAAERRAADLEKKNKEYEDAKLSEQERLTKQATEAETAKATAEAELAKLRADRAIERAAAKAGFIDPEDAVLSISRTSLKLEDDGSPTPESLDRALKALAESKPHLLNNKGGGKGSWDGGPRGKTSPAGADMNNWIREQAGRP